MTIIIAVKTDDGILSSDSIETINAEYIISDDLNNFLQSKNIDITDNIKNIADIEVKFQVKELKQYFENRALTTKNRLSYTDNHKKIFKLSDCSAILCSGNIDFGTITFNEMLSEITNEIGNKGIVDFCEVIC